MFFDDAEVAEESVEGIDGEPKKEAAEGEEEVPEEETSAE